MAGGVYPSMALAEIVGQHLTSRDEIFVRLLHHVDTHALREPGDHQIIRCDARLRAAFGVETMTMAEMDRLIEAHVV